MFITPAYAQTAAAAAPAGGAMDGVMTFLPLVAIFALMYFLIIRPQQKRAKQHQEMIKAVKRGDEVVLSSGVVGKVNRVEDTECMVEIATGVSIRVVKAMISEVRTKGAPVVANDTKS